MTLDPVHFDGIARLAGRIRQGVDERDHRDFAETVWDSLLDPLRDDGDRVLEPLDTQRRLAVPIEDVALQADAFPTQHGVDSGTINPTSFTNGLTVDVAQAAMSATPSDLDLHRARTVVATVHSNDVATGVDEADWSMFDEGFSRGRVLQAPRVDQYETTVVHELALHLAESQHARDEAGIVEDLLVLDGPIYPKGLLNWADREPALATLLTEEEQPRDVVANYLRLVEEFADRGVPLYGFVKTPISRAITRTVRATQGGAPWVNDAAFFRHVLERRHVVDGEPARDDDHLTYTNWFVSRGGADRFLAADADAFGLERRRDPADYEVTFFALYDPRDDAVYRVEAPAWVTRDPDRRGRLTGQVLADVAAARGPPRAVAKADELARIGRAETGALRDLLADAFSADAETTYDERRWGLSFG